MQEVREEGGERVCVCVFVFERGLATKANPCRIRAAFSTPIKSQSHVGNALALVHHRETEQLLFWSTPILVLFVRPSVFVSALVLYYFMDVLRSCFTHGSVRPIMPFIMTSCGFAARHTLLRPTSARLATIALS